MGPGLLESAYEGAMVVELAHNGIPFERQKVYPLEYRGEYIGVYIADIVAENTIIIELKAVARLNEARRVCPPWPRRFLPSLAGSWKLNRSAWMHLGCACQGWQSNHS